MRPPSIINFERLFLVAMALGVIDLVVGYETATEQLTREPALRQLGIGGSELFIGISAAWLAVYLLLWFLIARKASNVAKWILVILSAIGAIFFVLSLTGRWDLALLLTVAYYALELAAVACLFRADATAWLKAKPDTDQAALD
jgi:hypothetical protein